MTNLLGSSAPRLLLLCAVLTSSSLARAATWYVPADEPTGSEPCGTLGVDQFPLDEAFSVSASEDLIMLCNGTHRIDTVGELRIEGPTGAFPALADGVTISGQGDTIVTAAADVTWEDCPPSRTPLGTTCYRTQEAGDTIFDLWAAFNAVYTSGGVDGQFLVDNFPIYGSYVDGRDTDGDGEPDESPRISLVPYKAAGSFGSLQEDYTGALDEVYYGPGLLFDWPACKTFRTGGGGTEEECRVHLRVDQVSEANPVHGLDLDGSGPEDPDDVIDLDSVRLYGPHSWQFHRVEGLTLTNLEIADVPRLYFNDSDDVTLDSVAFSGRGGVKFSKVPGGHVTDVTVDNGFPRTLYWKDLKEQATGEDWDGYDDDYGCGSGAAQLLCATGLSIVNESTGVVVEHSVIRATWYGIAVGVASAGVTLSRNRVEWARDDAIRLDGTTSFVDVTHNEVVNSYLGVALIATANDSASLLGYPTHFVHHNVVDLARDLGPSGTSPVGSTNWLGAARRDATNPLSPEEPVYRTNAGLGFFHIDDGGNRRLAWPLVVYNNTFVADTWGEQGDDDSAVAAVYFPSRIPDPGDDPWEGPTTFFVNNVVVQENGGQPVVANLLWAPRDGSWPSAISDGNAWLQYAPDEVTPRAKFFDVTAILEGVPLGGGAFTIDACEDLVEGDLDAWAFLGQEEPGDCRGDPGHVIDRCWGPGRGSQRFEDLGALKGNDHWDPFWVTRSCGGGPEERNLPYGTLVLRACERGTGGSCDAWDDTLFDVFSDSADPDWSTLWLDCLPSADCDDGLEANSVDPTPQSFYDLTADTDPISSVDYIPAFGFDSAGQVALSLWNAVLITPPLSTYVDAIDSEWLGACDPNYYAACGGGPCPCAFGP